MRPSSLLARDEQVRAIVLYLLRRHPLGVSSAQLFGWVCLRNAGYTIHEFDSALIKAYHNKEIMRADQRWYIYSTSVHGDCSASRNHPPLEAQEKEAIIKGLAKTAKQLALF